MRFFQDLSLSACAAGFVAVLVGLATQVAIVFQAALAFGATPAHITSWMWALGLGMGLCSLVPSLLLRQPVMVAWSTPGAAVLASAGLAGGLFHGRGRGCLHGVCSPYYVLVGATGLVRAHHGPDSGGNCCRLVGGGVGAFRVRCVWRGGDCAAFGAEYVGCLPAGASQGPRVMPWWRLWLWACCT